MAPTLSAMLSSPSQLPVPQDQWGQCLTIHPVCRERGRLDTAAPKHQCEARGLAQEQLREAGGVHVCVRACARASIPMYTYMCTHVYVKGIHLGGPFLLRPTPTDNYHESGHNLSSMYLRPRQRCPPWNTGASLEWRPDMGALSFGVFALQKGPEVLVR